MEISNLTTVLTIVGANLVLIVAMIGTTIGLFMHLDNKTAAMIKSIQDEMKDFHGKLCAIEERSKK